MFYIDPQSYHNGTEETKEIQGIRNLFCEVLRRAIEDLRYYKENLNTDYWIRFNAYVDARSAQSWCDELVPSAAITFPEVCDILGLDKSRIHNYLDTHELRFTPLEEAYFKARRQAFKIRFNKIKRSGIYCQTGSD